MSSPADLVRSVREFEAMLDRMRWTGTRQVAELKQLEILVGKYPEQARELVNRRQRRAGRASVNAATFPTQA